MVCRFFIAGTSLVVGGSSSCTSRALGFWLSGCDTQAWIALKHVGSSCTRDRMHVTGLAEADS